VQLRPAVTQHTAAARAPHPRFGYNRRIASVVQAQEGVMVARTVVALRLRLPHRAQRLVTFYPEVQQ